MGLSVQTPCAPIVGSEIQYEARTKKALMGVLLPLHDGGKIVDDKLMKGFKRVVTPVDPDGVSYAFDFRPKEEGGGLHKEAKTKNWILQCSFRDGDIYREFDAAIPRKIQDVEMRPSQTPRDTFFLPAASPQIELIRTIRHDMGGIISGLGWMFLLLEDEGPKSEEFNQAKKKLKAGLSDIYDLLDNNVENENWHALFSQAFNSFQETIEQERTIEVLCEEIHDENAEDLRNSMDSLRLFYKSFVSEDPIQKVDLARLFQVIYHAEVDHMSDFYSLEVQCEEGSEIVLAQEGGLYRALLNVVRNALDAMEKQRSEMGTDPERFNFKGNIWVNIAGVDEGYTTITITDDGPGMPEEGIKAFYEDKSYSTKFFGGGRGLRTAKTVIERNGGTIDVASEPGKGTTFTIKLPRHSENDDALSILKKYIADSKLGYIRTPDPFLDFNQYPEAEYEEFIKKAIAPLLVEDCVTKADLDACRDSASEENKALYNSSERVRNNYQTLRSLLPDSIISAATTATLNAGPWGIGGMHVRPSIVLRYLIGQVEDSCKIRIATKDAKKVISVGTSSVIFIPRGEKLTIHAEGVPGEASKDQLEKAVDIVKDYIEDQKVWDEIEHQIRGDKYKETPETTPKDYRYKYFKTLRDVLKISEDREQVLPPYALPGLDHEKYRLLTLHNRDQFGDYPNSSAVAFDFVYPYTPGDPERNIISFWKKEWGFYHNTPEKHFPKEEWERLLPEFKREHIKRTEERESGNPERLRNNTAEGRNAPFLWNRDDHPPIRMRYEEKYAYSGEPYRAFMDKVLGTAQEEQPLIEAFFSYLEEEKGGIPDYLKRFTSWSDHTHDDSFYTFGMAVVGVEFPPERLQEARQLLVDFEEFKAAPASPEDNAAEEIEEQNSIAHSIYKHVLELKKEIDELLEKNSEEAVREEVTGRLREIIGFYKYRTMTIRRSLLRVIEKYEMNARRALIDALEDENNDIVEAAIISLGYIDRSLPTERQMEDIQRIKPFLESDDSKMVKASLTALRYIVGDEKAPKSILKQEESGVSSNAVKAAALRVMLEFLKKTAEDKNKKKHQFTAIAELCYTRNSKLIIPIIKVLTASKKDQKITERDIHAFLALVIDGEWMAGAIYSAFSEKNEDALDLMLLLAKRFGYLSNEVSKNLNEENFEAVVEILRRVGIVTPELVKAYQDDKEKLSLWERRLYDIHSALGTDETMDIRKAFALDISDTDEGKIDRALLLGALRLNDSWNIESKTMPVPFYYKHEEEQSPGEFFYKSPDRFILSTYSRGLKTVREIFEANSASQELEELLAPYAIMDYMSVLTETRNEELEEEELKFFARWAAIARMIEIKDRELAFKPGYLEFIKKDYPGEIEPSGKPSELISKLISSKYNKIWKFSLLNPAHLKNSDSLIRKLERKEEWGELSFGARSYLRLFAYHLFNAEEKDSGAIEKELEAELKNTLDNETRSKDILPSIGVEIQSPNVPGEKSYAWKRMLEHFDIPSPRRLQFYKTVEAAFQPARSTYAYLRMIPILVEMGLHEKYGRGSAFHISIAGDLGSEAKYIALPLKHFKFKEDTREHSDIERYIGMTRVMSKGLVHHNPDSVPLSEKEEAPEMHTEMRVTVLQNTTKESGELSPLFRDFLPAAHFLAAALTAHQKSKGEGEVTDKEKRLADIWTEYRGKVEELYNDPAYGTAKLLELDWYESTGDPRDPYLVAELEITQAMDKVRNFLKEKPDSVKELKEKAIELFLRYAGMISDVLGEDAEDKNKEPEFVTQEMFFDTSFIQKQKDESQERFTVVFDMDLTIAMQDNDGRNFLPKWWVQPEIFKLLDSLKSAGIKICLWTNGDKPRVESLFNYEPRFREYFELAVGSDSWKEIPAGREDEFKEMSEFLEGYGHRKFLSHFGWHVIVDDTFFESNDNTGYKGEDERWGYEVICITKEHFRKRLKVDREDDVFKWMPRMNVETILEAIFEIKKQHDAHPYATSIPGQDAEGDDFATDLKHWYLGGMDHSLKVVNGIRTEIPFTVSISKWPHLPSLKGFIERRGFLNRISANETFRRITGSLVSKYALGEVLKNSYDAVVDKITEEGLDPEEYPGKIILEAYFDGDEVVINVTDNGKTIEFTNDNKIVYHRKSIGNHFGFFRQGLGITRRQIRAGGGEIMFRLLSAGTRCQIKVGRWRAGEETIKKDDFIELEGEAPKPASAAGAAEKTQEVSFEVELLGSTSLIRCRKISNETPLVLFEHLKDLPPGKEFAISEVLAELSFNIMRHANGGIIKVYLEKDAAGRNTRLKIVSEDNGKGLPGGPNKLVAESLRNRDLKVRKKRGFSTIALVPDRVTIEFDHDRWERFTNNRDASEWFRAERSAISVSTGTRFTLEFDLEKAAYSESAGAVDKEHIDKLYVLVHPYFAAEEHPQEDLDVVTARWKKMIDKVSREDGAKLLFFSSTVREWDYKFLLRAPKLAKFLAAHPLLNSIFRLFSLGRLSFSHIISKRYHTRLHQYYSETMRLYGENAFVPARLYETDMEHNVWHKKEYILKHTDHRGASGVAQMELEILLYAYEKLGKEKLVFHQWVFDETIYDGFLTKTFYDKFDRETGKVRIFGQYSSGCCKGVRDAIIKTLKIPPRNVAILPAYGLDKHYINTYLPDGGIKQDVYPDPSEIRKMKTQVKEGSITPEEYRDWFQERLERHRKIVYSKDDELAKEISADEKSQKLLFTEKLSSVGDSEEELFESLRESLVTKDRKRTEILLAELEKRGWSHSSSWLMHAGEMEKALKGTSIDSWSLAQMINSPLLLVYENIEQHVLLREKKGNRPYLTLWKENVSEADNNTFEIHVIDGGNGFDLKAFLRGKRDPATESYGVAISKIIPEDMARLGGKFSCKYIMEIYSRGRKLVVGTKNVTKAGRNIRGVDVSLKINFVEQKGVSPLSVMAQDEGAAKVAEEAGADSVDTISDSTSELSLEEKLRRDKENWELGGMDQSATTNYELISNLTEDDIYDSGLSKLILNSNFWPGWIPSVWDGREIDAFVAYVGEKPAAVYSFIKMDEDNVQANGIYVFEDFRGLGIGSRLREELISYLKRMGYKTLTIGGEGHNRIKISDKAQKFHELLSKKKGVELFRNDVGVIEKVTIDLNKYDGLEEKPRPDEIENLIRQIYPDAPEKHVEGIARIVREQGITDIEEIKKLCKKWQKKTGAIRIRKDDDEVSSKPRVWGINILKEHFKTISTAFRLYFTKKELKVSQKIRQKWSEEKPLPDGSPYKMLETLRSFYAFVPVEQIREKTKGRMSDGHLSPETVERDLRTLHYLGLVQKGFVKENKKEMFYKVSDLSPPAWEIIEPVIKHLGARPKSAEIKKAKEEISKKLKTLKKTLPQRIAGLITQLKEIQDPTPEAHAARLKIATSISELGFPALKPLLDLLKELYAEQTEYSSYLKVEIVRAIEKIARKTTKETKEEISSALNPLIETILTIKEDTPRRNFIQANIGTTLAYMSTSAIKLLLDELKKVEGDNPEANIKREGLSYALGFIMNKVSLFPVDTLIPVVRVLLDTMQKVKGDTPDANAARIAIAKYGLYYASQELTPSRVHADPDTPGAQRLIDIVDGINKRGPQEVAATIEPLLKTLSTIDAKTPDAKETLEAIYSSIGKSSHCIAYADSGEQLSSALEPLMKLAKVIPSGGWVGKTARKDVAAALAAIGLKVSMEPLLNILRKPLPETSEEKNQLSVINEALAQITKRIDELDVEKNISLIQPLIEILTKATDDLPDSAETITSISKILGAIAEKSDHEEVALTTKPLFNTLNRITQDDTAATIARGAITAAIGANLRIARQKYGPELLLLLKKVNKSAEDHKKIDVGSFIKRHAATFTCLSEIDKLYAGQIFTDLLNSLGPARLDDSFNYIRPLVIHPVYSSLLTSIFKHARDRDYFVAMRILELARACQVLNYRGVLEELSLETRKKELSLDEINTALSMRILKKFAMDLGMDAETISTERISDWNLPYLGKLFVARNRIQEKGATYTMLKSIFDSIIRSSLEGRFQDFLINPDSGYEAGREVSRHNRRVRARLNRLGIDVDTWLNYVRTETITLKVKKGKIKLENNFEKINSFLKELLEEVHKESPKRANALEGAFAKLDLRVVRNENAISLVKVTSGQLNPDLKETAKQLLPDENIAILNKTFDFVSNNSDSEKVKTLVWHLKEELSQLRRLVKEYSEQKRHGKLKRNVTIRTWRRSPGWDLFQGNYTGCCISPDNTLHPEAILEYLIDQGIQIVEIIDEDSGRTIAQAFCFIGEDDKKRPILVIDSIQIAGDYKIFPEQKNSIKDIFLKYVTTYGKDIGCQALYIGKTPYGSVETKDFELVPNTVKKTGGYIWDHEGQTHHYYLEALVGEDCKTPREQIRFISDLVPDATEPKRNIHHKDTSKLVIRVLREQELTAAMANNLDLIAEANMPLNVTVPREELEKDGIHVVVEDGDDVVGCITTSSTDYDLSSPSNIDELDISAEDKVIYVDDIQMLPEYQGTGVFTKKLWKSFTGEARKRGVTKIIFHARILNGASRMLQKIGAKRIKTAPRWLGNEDFDLLAIDVAPLKEKPRLDEEREHSGELDNTRASVREMLEGMTGDKTAKGSRKIQSKGKSSRIDALMKDLKAMTESSDYWVRHTAFKDINELTNKVLKLSKKSLLRKAAYALFLEVLNNKNWFMRSAAVSGLSAIGDPSTVPYLLDALEKESRRKKSLEHGHVDWDLEGTIVKLSDLTSKNHLIKALKSKQWFVRKVALEALWEIVRKADVKTRKEMTSVLLGALKDRNQVIKKLALLGLAETGDIRAIEPLCKAISSGNAYSHSPGEMNSLNSLARLGSLLKDNPEKQIEIASIIVTAFTGKKRMDSDESRIKLLRTLGIISVRLLDSGENGKDFVNSKIVPLMIDQLSYKDSL